MNNLKSFNEFIIESKKNLLDSWSSDLKEHGIESIFTNTKNIIQSDYNQYQKALNKYIKDNKIKGTIYDILEKLPLENINANKLVASQEWLNVSTVKYFIKNPNKISTDNSDTPSIIEYNGNYWIKDGHHRLAAAIILGNNKIKARVLYLG